MGTPTTGTSTGRRGGAVTPRRRAGDPEVGREPAGRADDACPSPNEPRDRTPRHLLPGVVHIADWLDPSEQGQLAEEFRAWALPPAGLRHPASRPVIS